MTRANERSLYPIQTNKLHALFLLFVSSCLIVATHLVLRHLQGNITITSGLSLQEISNILLVQGPLFSDMVVPFIFGYFLARRFSDIQYMRIFIFSLMLLSLLYLVFSLFTGNEIYQLVRSIASPAGYLFIGYYSILIFLILEFAGTSSAFLLIGIVFKRNVMSNK